MSKLKVVEFCNEKCVVHKQEYVLGGIALQLVSLEDGLPVATATSYVDGLMKHEIAIKNYSENEGIMQLLLDAGIVARPHRYIKSGFVEFPICEFLGVEEDAEL